jgi:hypothetical protein
LGASVALLGNTPPTTQPASEPTGKTPSTSPAQIKLSIPDKLTFCTVRLSCILENGETSTGTAFFFVFRPTPNRPIPVLVTNRHVIKNAVRGTFYLTRRDSEGKPKFGDLKTVTLDNFEKLWIPHPDKSVDLCVLPVESLLNEFFTKGEPVFFQFFTPEFVATKKDLEDLPALAEVIMVGYPIGIWDSKNNMPILRRGVTATPPFLNYEGRSEFMVDLACLPGSSGSPVILYSVGSYTHRTGEMAIGEWHAMLLGVLYAGPKYTLHGEIEIEPVPTRTTQFQVPMIPTNLGYVIKAERILEFEPILVDLMKQQTNQNNQPSMNRSP